MLAHDERRLADADRLRRHDFIGFGILQNTVLVNAALVRKRVPADDRLVVLHREVRHGGDQPRRTRQHLAFDAGTMRQQIVTRADRHHDFFQRGVSGALSEPVDRAFDLPCTSAHAGERVGNRETQVVVAMRRQHDLLDARHAIAQHHDQIVIVLRQRIADGIGNVDRRRARLNDRFDDAAEIIVLCARRVHRAPLDVVGVLPRPRHRRDHFFMHLILIELQLMLTVQGRRADESVNTAALGELDGFACAVDIAEVGARQSADDRRLRELGDFRHRFEVAFGRNRKSGLDDVDAHLVEKFGDLQFFFKGHRRAGALLAVAQRRIEYDDLFGRCRHGCLLFCRANRSRVSPKPRTTLVKIVPPLSTTRRSPVFNWPRGH